MNLVIKIWDNVVSLTLVEKRKTLDKIVFPLEHNLTEKLLPEIDKLLQRNKLTPKNVSKAVFKTNIKNSFTSVRIGKVVANSWNWTKERVAR